jgi:geranylgeranyl diphosphate synthase type I
VFSAPRLEIETTLKDFLERTTRDLSEISAELAPVSAEITSFLATGKRFRPLFAYAGYLAAGGQNDGAQLKNMLKAATSLELLQACALIHDDLMDGSDMRRGAPAVHRYFENYHFENSMRGDKTQFGLSAAILLGDFALIWADQLINESGLSDEQLRRLLPLNDLMRIELIAGQYLDVRESAATTSSVERALKVARYKSGKYTIERPLHFGALIAGSSDETNSALTKFGIPLGEAFQLRDDLLGVFGDPETTGKPAGDDLREGKRTVLTALAIESFSAQQAQIFNSHFGALNITTEQISELRDIITEVDAPAKVEALIEDLTASALRALESEHIAENSKPYLNELALMATKRKI